ncbi:MAG: hypothetical protein KAQ92_07070 [Candidatus Aenigmarchaeota archaeon]|nr:hypothetical protein [Candidatus Aenigmarchaeota archaeon]
MESICKKKILAVEGKDCVGFFNAFLEYLKITDFEIYDIGGTCEFKDNLGALFKRRGFSDVEIFGIICDAENNDKSAFQRIQNILKNNDIKPPREKNRFFRGKPNIGIFIMSGNSNKGMLEDLCLKTVEKHPAMECVNNFANCVSKLQNPPKIVAKSKAQVYLAAMPKIVNSIGLGAKNGYWNFESKELFDLKKFMRKFE